MKKLVIIGFDGTIADTAPGILYCMNTSQAFKDTVIRRLQTYAHSVYT